MSEHTMIQETEHTMIQETEHTMIQETEHTIIQETEQTMTRESDPVITQQTDHIMTQETNIHAMRWDGQVPVSPHQHDFIEIAFLTRGSCLHAWQGLEVRLVPGDVFVISPGEKHAYRIEGKTTIYNCLFYPSGLGVEWEILQRKPALQNILVLEPLYREDTGRQEILHLGRMESEEFERLWTELIAECETPSMGCREARKALLMILLVRMGRAWEKQFEGLAGLYGVRRNLLAEALSHIEQNAAGELSLAELASRCHVSQGHFRKLFRETTGLSPLEYVNKLRISMAQRLPHARCSCHDGKAEIEILC